MGLKNNLSTFFGIFLVSMLFVPPSMPTSEAQEDYTIPSWIKNNAGWWAEGQIDDSSFLQAIQYLIENGIIVVPVTEAGTESSSGVPAWIKNNAGWWADGQIDDITFISAIQYLIKAGIIVVEQEQTQPTVSDKEIQKLADEYWDCTNFDPSPSSTCFAPDHAKYTVGGIEGPTQISWYFIETLKDRTFWEDCGRDCNILTTHNMHFSSVDVKLKKFQDENMHKQLFDMYVSITPKQILGEVVFLRISTDDYAGEVAGVGRAIVNPLKFSLRIDPLDMAPLAGPIDEMFHKATMIHENAHILSLGSSQADNDGLNIELDLSEEPYTELRKIVKEKEATCAPNYYSDIAGCMNGNSYLNLFFQKFWADIYPSFKWFYEFDDYDEFLDHNALFYEKYSTQFVQTHSASNPEEDFAESFLAFVLKEKPRKPTVNFIHSDQKILFFYDFPELVEMRDFIRSNL